MEHEHELEKLTDAIYSSAAQPSNWCDVLSRLGRVVQAGQIGLLRHDFLNREGVISFCSGFSPDRVAEYQSRQAPQNVWLRGLPLLEPGTIVLGADLVPVWELVRTAFYREWLRPQNAFHALLGLIDRQGHAVHLLVALRPTGSGEFGSAERLVFQALLPHIRRASDLAGRFRRAAEQARILNALIDDLPEAILLVDRESRLVRSNPAADRLLAAGRALRLVGNRVVAGCPEENGRLHAAVAGAARIQPAEPTAPGRRLLIGRAESSAALLLNIQPVGSASEADGAEVPLAAIITRDPEGGFDIPPAQLRQLFSMTPAEARLTALLLNGHSLLSAATALHISKNTARTHMKRVYAKTETHQRSDLLRLLGLGHFAPDEAAIGHAAEPADPDAARPGRTRGNGNRSGQSPTILARR